MSEKSAKIVGSNPPPPAAEPTPACPKRSYSPFFSWSARIA
jgi:hypothetical protein